MISAAGTKEKVANENIIFSDLISYSNTSRSFGTVKVFVTNLIDMLTFILSIISFPASLSYC